MCGESQDTQVNREIEMNNEDIPEVCHPCSEESEEAKKAKGIQVSEAPSQKEVDEHMLTHIPFRSCCKSCAMGIGVSPPHRKMDKSKETIPTISIDYGILNEKHEIASEERNGMLILALRIEK